MFRKNRVFTLTPSVAVVLGRETPSSAPVVSSGYTGGRNAVVSTEESPQLTLTLTCAPDAAVTRARLTAGLLPKWIWKGSYFMWSQVSVTWTPGEAANSPSLPDVGPPGVNSRDSSLSSPPSTYHSSPVGNCSRPAYDRLCFTPVKRGAPHMKI